MTNRPLRYLAECTNCGSMVTIWNGTVALRFAAYMKNHHIQLRLLDREAREMTDARGGTEGIGPDRTMTESGDPTLNREYCSMKAIPRWTRILRTAPLALGLIACAQLDVNESPSGTSQPPQQYGAAAGSDPVAVLTTAQAQRLKRLMDPLIRHMNQPLPADQVRVTVLQDSHINAANGGGGDFYVTSGLLQKAKDAELRGILAHEIAHADLGHVNKIQTVSAGVGIGAALLGAIWPSSEQLAPLVGKLVLSHYSRTEETAADKQGVIILNRAGFSGTAVMVDTLTWIANTEGASSGGFLATHPATADRIQALNAMR